MWRQLHMLCQGQPPSHCLRPFHPRLRSFTLFSAARDSGSSVALLYPPVYSVYSTLPTTPCLISVAGFQLRENLSPGAIGGYVCVTGRGRRVGGKSHNNSNNNNNSVNIKRMHVKKNIPCMLLPVTFLCDGMPPLHQKTQFAIKVPLPIFQESYSRLRSPRRFSF